MPLHPPQVAGITSGIPSKPAVLRESRLEIPAVIWTSPRRMASAEVGVQPSLVGVGCRLMVLGPSVGTLAGTLKWTPMCAYQAHIVLP